MCTLHLAQDSLKQLVSTPLLTMLHRFGVCTILKFTEIHEACSYGCYYKFIFKGLKVGTEHFPPRVWRREPKHCGCSYEMATVFQVWRHEHISVLVFSSTGRGLCCECNGLLEEFSLQVCSLVSRVTSFHQGSQHHLHPVICMSSCYFGGIFVLSSRESFGFVSDVV